MFCQSMRMESRRGRSHKYTQKTHGCECKLTFFWPQKHFFFLLSFYPLIHSEKALGLPSSAQLQQQNNIFSRPFLNFEQTNNSFILGKPFFVFPIFLLQFCMDRRQAIFRVQQIFIQHLTWLFLLLLYPSSFSSLSEPFSYISEYTSASRPSSFIAVCWRKTSCWHWFSSSFLPLRRVEKSLWLFLFTF